MNKEKLNKEEKIQAAQEAYIQGDKEMAKKVHEQTIEEHNTSSGKYLKNMVYGGLDGIITTFAVVAGVAGANLAPTVTLILGFANLFADGISMSMGDYLSSKSEQEYNNLERKRETWEMQHYPEGEIKEMMDFYKDKGMSEEDANIVVPAMAKYTDLFVDVMMVEELGIIEDNERPIKSALVTFFSFLVFGFVPLITTVLSSYVPAFENNGFIISAIMTAFMLFLLGFLKGRVTGVNKFKSGLDMLLLGGLAAAAAYLIGNLLGNV